MTATAGRTCDAPPSSASSPGSAQRSALRGTRRGQTGPADPVGPRSHPADRTPPEAAHRPVSIQEAVDTFTATGKMFYTLVTVISEWERGVIGERTKEALAHKRRNGERIGVIPYGFTLARNRKTLEEVPDETKMIAQIRHKRERLHLSFARIATDLNTKGIPAKQGGRWQPATVHSILRTLHRHAGMVGRAGATE